MAPERQRQVTLAYAATASLAAVTLVYVFGPTWFIDTSVEGSPKDRRFGVVGLANPANDCFALAGLEDLRTYLSKRTLAALQRGHQGDDGVMIGQKPFLTAALKDILDNLNERPIYRKTITNQPFLIVLERVFKRRISRAQQDAHEFLQVVAETLAEEHHRLRRLERQDRKTVSKRAIEEALDEGSSDEEEAEAVLRAPQYKEEEGRESGKEQETEEEEEEEELQFEGMPLEGRLTSEIECQTCRFKPKPTVSQFVVLTLPVPQKSSATLSECIAGTLSTEYIDDFQCAKCRLQHAIAAMTRKCQNTTNDSTRQILEGWIPRLQHALISDPENIPDDIELPPLNGAPKSRIVKRTRIQDYPGIIALHLSRSIYDSYASRKNVAKVSFDETLQMGGLLYRRNYRLLCVVTHKGGHDSGHYECFRRQIVARPPFSIPTSLVSSPNSPVMSFTRVSETSGEGARLSGETMSPNETPRSSWSSANMGIEMSRAPTPTPSEQEKRAKMAKKLRRKRGNDRWWRISDDKIKEARTSDVLGLQKEVYLLFYQRDWDEDANAG